MDWKKILVAIAFIAGIVLAIIFVVRSLDLAGAAGIAAVVSVAVVVAKIIDAWQGGHRS